MNSIPTHQFDSVDSTNDVAKRFLAKKSTVPFVVMADMQRSGRGRLGRKWFSSSPDGLYYSFTYAPGAMALDGLGEFSMGIGYLVRDVVRQHCDVDLDIEWPNDLILNARKIGGILVETAIRSGSDRPSYVIIGIGLNVNQREFPDELKRVASSLSIECGREFDKSKIALGLTTALYRMFGRMGEDL